MIDNFKFMDEIIHGLDLPDEISERNNEIIKKMLGITDEEINAVEIDGDDEDNREDDILFKKIIDNIVKAEDLTEEEHKRAMSDEFSYLDDDDDNDDAVIQD